MAMASVSLILAEVHSPLDYARYGENPSTFGGCKTTSVPVLRRTEMTSGTRGFLFFYALFHPGRTSTVRQTCNIIVCRFVYLTFFDLLPIERFRQCTKVHVPETTK